MNKGLNDDIGVMTLILKEDNFKKMLMIKT